MTTIQSILSRLTKAVGGTEKMLYIEPELNKFAEFYLDKWDENTSEDVILTSGGTQTGLAEDVQSVAD